MRQVFSLITAGPIRVLEKAGFQKEGLSGQNVKLMENGKIIIYCHIVYR
ncbi:hypothetical protein ACEQPO_15980 [Bacillus sp. SL00103]